MADKHDGEMNSTIIQELSRVCKIWEKIVPSAIQTQMETPLETNAGENKMAEEVQNTGRSSSIRLLQQKMKNQLRIKARKRVVKPKYRNKNNSLATIRKTRLEFLEKASARNKALRKKLASKQKENKKLTDTNLRMATDMILTLADRNNMLSFFGQWISIYDTVMVALKLLSGNNPSVFASHLLKILVDQQPDIICGVMNGSSAALNHITTTINFALKSYNIPPQAPDYQILHAEIRQSLLSMIFELHVEVVEAQAHSHQNQSTC